MDALCFTGQSAFLKCYKLWTRCVLRIKVHLWNDKSYGRAVFYESKRISGVLKTMDALCFTSQSAFLKC